MLFRDSRLGVFEVSQIRCEIDFELKRMLSSSLISRVQ